MKSRGNREKVVIVTKVGSDMGQGKKDLSAAYIAKAAEDSLKRLQVDEIDLYLSHWPDDTVPYDETLGAYEKLMKAGKVRNIGCSNLDAGRLEAALKVASQKKLPRYEVLQPEYNLYDRSSFDGQLRDLCMKEEIGVITYFSLAEGFLSGKYRSEADLGKSPRGDGIAKYLDSRGKRILAALDAVSARHNAKQAEVALAWIIARPGVTAPISSATTIEQVDSLIRAARLQLTAADIKELDQASTP
jgi:aryl-alcohol dehydrogenase-like predicted oxidoreductase